MIRKALIAAAALAGLGVGAYFGKAVHAIETANPNWLSLAFVAFVGATVAAAGSWSCAVGLAGGKTDLIDSCARYGAGSLVNTFVLAALVGAGALAGAIPLWPLGVLAGLVAAAIGTSYFARRHDLGHFLDAFQALDRRSAPRLIGWLVASTVCRYLAAAATCASLGIHAAFAGAIIILPALDLAGLFPVTPGNVGLTSGAIAVALKAHHVAFHSGLAAGLAFHTVETAVGLLFGVAAVVWFAPAIKAGARLTSTT